MSQTRNVSVISLVCKEVHIKYNNFQVSTVAFRVSLYLVLPMTSLYWTIATSEPGYKQTHKLRVI